MQLSQRIKNTNDHLFFDNYFSSYNLFQYLNRRGIYAAGTFRLNWFKNLPFKSDNKMKLHGRGYSENVISRDGDVVLTKWCDVFPCVQIS